MRHVIVGTAGHIDHGKSSLVAALTGTHPDRLEEEKRRGITIDLGFAFLNLGNVSLGFVDVPGHERFVRNMLAGAGGIDLVLLVIAADESIKPQTREHFDICRLLGISRGIVALTKTDLVAADAAGLAKLEAEELLLGSSLEGSPIVEVSAKTGAGLDLLRQELLRAAESVAGKDAGGYLRLPIDRAFAMKGFGTVVTGTLVSGTLRPEDEVELFPVQRRVRVRGLHSGWAAVEQAVAGQRTAVNLAGVEVSELGRGMSLAAPGVFHPTKRLDARIALLPSAPAWKSRSSVHFHQGTTETIAEVILLEGERLEPGGSAFAQLRLEEPALLLPGDRFILRRLSPVTTIGGGGVLDPLAPKHRAKAHGVIPLLETIERGDKEEILGVFAALDPQGMTLEHVVARTGWREAEARDAISRLAAQGRLVVTSHEPMTVASAAGVEACASAIRTALEEFERVNPLLPGLSKQDLRARAAAAGDALYRAALDQLATAKAVTISGDLVKSAGREIALLPEEARAKELIETEFERAGLAVPRFDEVLGKLPVEAKRAQKILQMLLREKTLVKVAEELVFHRNGVARLRELVAAYKKAKGEKLPIAAFKELTGVSRKYAIPLLEFLDRERVTRRAGDERVIL